MTRYPTQSEILELIEEPQAVFVDCIETWKRMHYDKVWRSLSVSDKFDSLAELARSVSNAGGKQLEDVVYGSVWAYNPVDRIVIMGEKPSIISTLHEVGHHLLGESETNACVFSISIFKTCFPKAYEALEWNGHMLMKRS